MLAILVVALKIVHFAVSCNTEFNFSENYGNGFFVTCTNISERNIHLLTDNKLQNEVRLSIVNSNLKNATSSLFNNFQSIKELQIKNSTFHFKANEPVFKSLHRLEMLTITQTVTEINGRTLEGLKELRSLQLEGNQLSGISESAFKNTPLLTTLKISANHVTDVGNIGLCFLKNLKTLDLSRNRINPVNSRSFLCTRQVAENIGFDLNGNHISVNGKESEYVDSSLAKSKLDSIDLSFNEIVQLNNVFQTLGNLKRISLEGNRLGIVQNGDFSSTSALKTLSLENNNISVIERLVFHDKKQLVYLSLEKNKLNTVFLSECPLLANLNLASNQFDCRGLMNFENLASLEILNLSKNLLSKGCNESFLKFRNVKELNLSENPLKLDDKLFKGFVNLTKLFLSKSGHMFLPSVIFHDLINMQYLDLSQNQIKSFDDTTFSTNVHLQTLNVSNNLLQNIQFTLIRSLKNLQVLDVSGNQLHYFEYKTIFTKLPSLSIDIKSNLFMCDFLSKMIGFFKNQSISYTINEHSQTDKENIDGIYCQEDPIPQIAQKSSGISFGAIFFICFAIIASIVGVVYIKKRYIFARRSVPSDFELLQ